MCEICRQIPCHSRCPNYVPLKTTHYCSICGDGIYDGEDYIENQDGNIFIMNVYKVSGSYWNGLDMKLRLWKIFMNRIRESLNKLLPTIDNLS